MFSTAQKRFDIKCPPKVIEQTKIFSHNFKKCVYLKCPLKLYGSMIRPNETLGPDLRSILFDTKHQFLLNTGCTAWDYLNCVAIYCFSNFTNCSRTFGGYCSRSVSPKRRWASVQEKKSIVVSQHQYVLHLTGADVPDFRVIKPLFKL